MSGPETTPTGVAETELLALEFSEDTSLDTPPTTLPQAEQQLPGSAGEHLLQEAYGDTKRARRFYRDQVLEHLNEVMIEFVERMEMAFVATSDAKGEADCSLRAGPAGFIRVLDRQHIAYPEYRGNGVHASLGNISENPHIGVMLVDFVRDLIGLHVNGKARIVEHEDMLLEQPQLDGEHEPGRRPQRWVVVDIHEAYIHCRKHIPRMQPVDRNRSWGTDDSRRKGGDYFGARAEQTQQAKQADQVEHAERPDTSR
ncbi:pyridoxamine 5'-phosphate oxidase family protein [Sciscionella marina]|uniref:pyridoxamine 5'-phosphate oxidase family protein n=1 Tax=Sciscionella marina TaxID=508770 RepID=UPI000372BC33|nr:pyridoxamine 5'-phosphate oxidase family protein [Sciscionella marina]